MKETITIKDGGYLIQRPHLSYHPWVLGVQGAPRQMGFQQGYLLAEIIRKTASGFLSPIFAQFGGWEPGTGPEPTLEQMHKGRSVLLNAYNAYFEPALKKQSPDLLEEMEGIADGLEEAGLDIPREDILIGNCIPEITELQFYVPSEGEQSGSNGIETKGCSDCIVWGKASHNKRLIHGTNYDYSSFNMLHKGIGIIIAKPDSGYPFLAQCLAGTVGFYRGVNNRGMTAGESTSESADRDIKNNPRIPHAMHMRKLIQFTASLDEAVDMMKTLQGTTGYNHSIGDAKVPSAVDIEASSTRLGVVYPQPDLDALWTTNQFTAYPGFRGYQGENLAEGQLAYWGIPPEKADSIESWKAVVLEETDERSYSWQRYEKLQQLVKDHYGDIDVDKMIQFLSVWPLTREPQDLGQLSGPCDQLYGLHGPIGDKKLASIFSAVFDTTDLTAWVAVGAEPAQAGPFWPVNLLEYLQLFEEPDVTKMIPQVDAEDGKRHSSSLN